MAKTPSETFAERMRQYRERRGWFQEDLAAKLTEVGWKVDRAQIARIEKRKRGISLDEAITISWVLGLPPAFLYLPVGDADRVSITPDLEVHPDRARRWATGQEPTPGTRTNRLVADWSDDMTPWRLLDQFNAAVDSVANAESSVSHAEYVGDPDEVKERRGDLVRALVDLGEASREIRDRGLHPPALSERVVEAMRSASIEYDGPVYPGLTEVEDR